MHRRTALSILAASAALPWLGRSVLAGTDIATASATAVLPLKKAHEEWRSILAADRYRVLFEEETERPRSSPLDKLTDEGTYLCAACYLPLFDSEHKFDSGTGWPSFFTHIEGRLDTKRDFRLVWPRTEYHCARCAGHQGHVFDDGPQPSGQRWCNNGLALTFVARGEPLPELRS